MQSNSAPNNPRPGAASSLNYGGSLLPGDESGLYYGLPLTAWFKIAAVTVLMCLTFRFNLVRLWAKTNPFFGEPNWRHAICVPLIGIYYLYVNRDDVTRAPVSIAWSGLGILVFGILTFVYGIYPGQNDFLKDLGMVIALFGVVTLLAGWKVIKVTWFPIVFLICALPWPELVYSKVAWPLQRLAASVAVGTLRYTGVEAFNTGTKIIISRPGRVDRTLNVAEACAGLRSLMTFISVAGAVAFLSIRPMWQKLVITLSGIPIAVFCNVMRVSGQGLLDHYASEEFAEGFAHQFVGIVMLVPGFFLILLTGWMLDKVFIEEAGERKAKRDVVRPGSEKRQQWTVPAAGLVAREPAPAGASASSARTGVPLSPGPRAPASRASVPATRKPTVAPAGTPRGTAQTGARPAGPQIPPRRPLTKTARPVPPRTHVSGTGAKPPARPVTMPARAPIIPRIVPQPGEQA